MLGVEKVRLGDDKVRWREGKVKGEDEATSTTNQE